MRDELALASAALGTGCILWFALDPTLAKMIACGCLFLLANMLSSEDWT